MPVYIHGMGNISAQHTWGERSLLDFVRTSEQDHFAAVEPQYESWIDPKHLRRMSRVIRMGVASSAMALKESATVAPDAIITGTGYGCLEDTGTFLTKLIENKEQALNPTPFIQSTHNTIGSQIALLLQCQGYNQTYAHGPFSFESALLDALLQSAEYPSRKILLGAVDEITPASHAIQSRFGKFKNDLRNGEGATFFLTSGERADSSASITAVQTIYKPDQNELENAVRDFVAAQAPFDLILHGTSGNDKYDNVLNGIHDKLFTGSKKGAFKHLCGEFPVSSAFACWLAARMIEEQRIPESVSPTSGKATLKNILILNQYFGTHFSLIQVKR